jgi:hypothetical protein
VKQCDAHVERDDIVLTVDAYAWVALDRDLGAVAVREFAHATVHAEMDLGVSARYVGGLLELTLTPRANARTTVEPVGTLDLEPGNWLGLLAIELAPSAGVSPEALAKAKMRDESERTLAATFSRPFSFTYDGRRGTVALSGRVTGDQPRRLRVASRGTALVGPFPPSSTASARAHVVSGAPVLGRPVCRSHAERLVDADRRGDAIGTHDWTSVVGDKAWTIPPMPCTWVLAFRSPDEVSIVDVPPIDVPPAEPAVERRERWVSVDDIVVVGTPSESDVFVIANDIARAQFFPRVSGAFPMLVKLGPDEHLTVRAQRDGVPLAMASVPDDATGHVDVSLSLEDAHGATIAMVRLRARIQAADE